MKVLPELTDHIVFHPDKFVTSKPRQRCFCRTKSNKQMMLCETCDEWYHWDCIGVTQEEAEAAVNWRCGYCRGDPLADGTCGWKLNIPQGERKRKKVAPPRKTSQTPKALGIPTDGDDFVNVGPQTWEDVVTMALAGGREINLKMQKAKQRATQIVKEGGHHIVDEMTMDGVKRRGVDDELVDELVQNGEIDLDEQEEGVPAEEESE